MHLSVGKKQTADIRPLVHFAFKDILKESRLLNNCPPVGYLRYEQAAKENSTHSDHRSNLYFV